MQNSIVWNRTHFDIETVYLYWTELFESELFCYLTELFWRWNDRKQKLYLY